jgi:hypothetical protein
MTSAGTDATPETKQHRDKPSADIMRSAKVENNQRLGNGPYGRSQGVFGQRKRGTVEASVFLTEMNDAEGADPLDSKASRIGRKCGRPA